MDLVGSEAPRPPYVRTYEQVKPLYGENPPRVGDTTAYKYTVEQKMGERESGYSVEADSASSIYP